MAAFTTMIYRQFIRFLRSRSRVIGMIINPLIWLVFFGLGWSKVFDNPWAKVMFGGVDYLTYLAPGIFAMTIFNMSFISGVSLIWDKQFGFFKEVLVAPSSRRLSIIGRIVGDGIVTVLQGFIILFFTYFLAENLKISGLIPALTVGFLMSVTIASLGITLALKMESTEGFQMIMMTLMMPLIFLSGAMYPIDSMPDWMKVIAYINPLTYAVDASRGYLVGTKTMKFSFGVDWGILSILMIVGIILATETFERARIN
ncbi:ABC transporter permease [Thermotoga sp. KOL6]|uniref:ABC transporter permease n=1 Tax=Thermotoga sp. KOL6 TaxID=126741 RepID=UPI000C77F579|nr:ABC transporter permease [Thermotoga sp. KOL6]PLV60068.1 ABC transporter [Thermotoga sp. KOL6]